MVEIYTKQSLIEKLRQIRDMGWILGRRQGNAGNVGNTLEDLLGIQENNLPIPNAAEWELKCQRSNTSSLTTLFHMEPSPTALKFVPNILLLKYGWPHRGAGIVYPENERSFRQTLSALYRTDRGFGLVLDKTEQKILVSFDSSAVSGEHAQWLQNIEKKELDPQPYWGFDDVFHKAGTKLLNCFYVVADVKKEDGAEYFFYKTIMKLSRFSRDKFLAAIENGDVLIDFDARTGHNHGTKFRFKNGKLPELYDEVEVI
ncbi:MAG: MvaI/BcnI restriction endonuclease family protein [Alphaproteobacteria bacterium]|nr:MvaI/BcnI restriction endonuclease family protein [Alphaproteobacteria bacterium]